MAEFKLRSKKKTSSYCLVFVNGKAKIMKFLEECTKQILLQISGNPVELGTNNCRLLITQTVDFYREKMNPWDPYFDHYNLQE